MKNLDETSHWRDAVIYIRDCATPLCIEDHETGMPSKVYGGADYFEEMAKAWCKYHCFYVVGTYHDTEKAHENGPSPGLREAAAHCRRKDGGASILVVIDLNHLAVEEELQNRIGEELYGYGVHVHEIASCKHEGFTTAMGIREVEWQAVSAQREKAKK